MSASKLPLSLPGCALCGGEFHLGSRCVRPIPEGARNDSLFRVGIRLARWGGRWFNEQRIKEHLLRDNATRCAPPLPEREVRQIAESAARSVLPALRRSAPTRD